MESPAKLHSFCHLCMSPSPHHHDHPHAEYSRCLEMRMNLDYSASRSSYDSPEMYPNSPYPGSPQSRSSCMYSLHANSPPIVHPLALRSSAEQFMSPSKENGLYREIPPQCRRRLDFNHNDFNHSDFINLSKAVPVTVAKRNERERNRVKLINTTFQTLRQHLPVQSRGAKGQAKKLSKVQTLRSAIEYIRNLEDLVEDRKGGKKSLSKEAIAEFGIKQEAFDDDDDDDEEVDDQRDVSDTDSSSFDTHFSKETKQYTLINNNNNTNNNNNNDLPTNNNNNERTASSHESYYYGKPNDSPCQDLNNIHINNDNNNNDNNNDSNNINNNTMRPSEVSSSYHPHHPHLPHHHQHQHHHREQHYPHHPRSHHHYHPKAHFQDGRPSSFEGVGNRYTSPSGQPVNKCHSEGGSASPVDSDISGDVTAAEEDEFFDFDLWFWTD